MNVLLSTVAVALAGFYIWSVVRAVNRRDRWAKWIASTVLIVLILYYVSCGPALWLFLKAGTPTCMEPLIVDGYAPVLRVAKSSEWLDGWHREYIGWWMELAADEKPYFCDTPNDAPASFGDDSTESPDDPDSADSND
jgi:hypothetical protein